MDFKVTRFNQDKLTCDTLVLTAWSEGVSGLRMSDQLCNGLVGRLWTKGKISGKVEQVKVIYTETPWEQVVILGLGEKDKFTGELARRCGADLAETLTGLKSRKASLPVEFENPAVTEAEALEALVEGMILGNYRFDKYRREDGEQEEEPTVEILAEDASLDTLGGAVHRAVVLAEATNLARDMVNEPGNKLTPAALAQRAQQVAAAYGLECRVLGAEEITGLGMGGLSGVTRGSAEEPRLIVLGYRGRGQGKAVGLVGKGITFDAGGISLKPVSGMEEMKSDMAGGAAVIAAMSAIARLKPVMDVTGVVPACENLPGGSALKPGDVIQILDGTTVEIISTDSEGRLILADGICYARRLGLEPVIDVATLTGACSVALGPVYTGLWSNSRELQEKVLEASRSAGEKVWAMPYDRDYYELTESRTADLKNSGGREGGACSAAAFLGHFAQETPWAHLDIAPTGFADNAQGYVKKGGTGAMVRTLARFVCRWTGE